MKGGAEQVWCIAYALSIIVARKCQEGLHLEKTKDLWSNTWEQYAENDPNQSLFSFKLITTLKSILCFAFCWCVAGKKSQPWNILREVGYESTFREVSCESILREVSWESIWREVSCENILFWQSLLCHFIVWLSSEEDCRNVREYFDRDESSSSVPYLSCVADGRSELSWTSVWRDKISWP